jgi:uncharacterized protein YndB with AHSA1/START domain
MTDQTSQNIETKNVFVTRVFNAPIERVWQAWSEPEPFMGWWGPMGFTCPVANLDFREGGTSLICMRAPQEYGGMDMYNTWTYEKIVPIAQIEFIQHFSDAEGNVVDPAAQGLPPDIPREVRHVITFKSLDDNQTEITVTEFGYTSDQVVEMSKMGMEQCLDKLAAILA